MTRPARHETFWRQRKIGGGVLAPIVLLAVLPASANAYPRPGLTERVSVASDGAQANFSSYDPAISADGRYVAFHSAASDLVPADTNGAPDVFVHDRGTGTTERVSMAFDGTEANSNSGELALSPDARHVTFQSRASNLVPADTNGTQDVFIHDRTTGAIERVSVASDGTEANGFSYEPAMSADGRYVAFDSYASNLVSGDTNGTWDVFVHDRATGATERVSVASGGAQTNGLSYIPAISADGRYVAFQSYASNLVHADNNGVDDVFVHDRATGSTERVSVASDGAETDGVYGSFFPAISADGGHVAFVSRAPNLVPGDTNGIVDMFVHDRAKGSTRRVSVASDGAETNGVFGSAYPAISADGAHVAFVSDASNLVPGDTNGNLDVFAHDLFTGATQRVSVASDGAEANSYSASGAPAFSADGRYLAFLSTGSNLVAADTNGAQDVFVHDRGGSLGVVGTPSVLNVPGGLEVSGRATFSGATLAGATDPDDDGTGMGLGAADAGAELTGSALIYRPEQEDLLLRLDLSSLPSDPAGAGLPGVLYGLELGSGGTTYEVRALRAGATSTTPRIPYVVLYRCAPVCTEHAPLMGSFGTTGEQILVSVPLSALGATEAAELTSLRAFTATGEAAPGALLPLDEVALSSSVIPASRVELGIANASTSEDDVAFTVEADLLSGDFSGTISTDGLSPGSYRVWARACLGDACGPASSEPVAL